MHPLAFKIKRVHHRILAYSRYLLRGLEPATPARLDLLYALERGRGSLEQQDLLAQLGIAPSTLSKMLKRMRELGLVTGEPVLRDKRRRKVSLTSLGRSLVRRAMTHIMEWAPLQLMFECFFGGPTFENFLRVDSLISRMAALARHMRDNAQLEYPIESSGYNVDRN